MIIGLTGYAQSGKDSIANILVERHGFTRVAFADKIRELLYEMDPPVPTGVGSESHVVGLQNYVDIYGWDEAKQNRYIRSMLQNLGVGARTIFGDMFWVHQAMNSLALAHPRIVVTDVRFINEASTIKINGGQLWRVEREGITAVNNHVSESEMRDYPVDSTIKNNGTLEELKAVVASNIMNILHEQQMDFE